MAPGPDGSLPTVPDRGSTTPAPGAPRVGIVGGGQLARMLGEAASALGIGVSVLAEHPDDAATGVADDLIVGRPDDAVALRDLVDRCSVVTFDHEQVDLTLLGELESAGARIRPGVVTLEMAVDKATMRQRLDEAGILVPAFAVLPPTSVADGPTEPDVSAQLEVIDGFTAAHGWPAVIKATRGGYDGKGVWPVHDHPQAAEVCRQAAASGTPLMIEAFVPFDTELAVMVARRPGGAAVTWPAVETAQIDGVCREVLVPGGLSPVTARSAEALALDVAEVAGLAGVLAVELFAEGGRLLVNEVAARPHNSGHWSIEGAVTSQFENHLRAVLDLPLGSTRLAAPHVANVNVFGDDQGTEPATRLSEALAVEGAHVHLYGKSARPGRKLGHVTVCGDEADDVRRRAWAAAQALGTPVPAALSSRGAP